VLADVPSQPLTLGMIGLLLSAFQVLSGSRERILLYLAHFGITVRWGLSSLRPEMP
jgi:hypothetical protein